METAAGESKYSGSGSRPWRVVFFQLPYWFLTGSVLEEAGLLPQPPISTAALLVLAGSGSRR